MTYFIDLHRLWEGTSTGTSQDPLTLLSGLGRVSVVLVARGRYDFLRSLESVISQPFLREVIIVDGGMSLSLRQSLENYIKAHSRCHMITGRELSGLAHAYNLGSHYCSGDYVFFMTEKSLLPRNALARLLSFARRKAPPYVIGLPAKARPSKAWLSRDHWVGKLLGFQNVFIPGTRTAVEMFTHVANVKEEGFFVSSRSFAMLRGLDEACFDQAMAWDFCLRAHYAGGDVLEASNLSIDYQAPVAGVNWLKHLRSQWRNYGAWRYVYQKYVSDKTHSLKRVKAHLFFLLQFMWAAGKL